MPRAVDHDARRDALCDAVVDVAVRRGFHAVTVRAVAGAVGASTSTVTHYVTGRDELVRLAVRREVATRRDHIDDAAAAPGAEGLRAVVEAAVLGATDRAQMFWLAVVVGAHHDPVLREELARFNSWWDTVVERLVRQAGLAGAAAATAADAVDIVTAGMITAAFERGAPWPPDRCRDLLDVLLVPLHEPDHRPEVSLQQ